MNLNLHRKKYVKLATLPIQNGVVLCAFLVIEEGGEIVFISEPKVIRHIQNKTPLLSGEISLSNLLGGETQRKNFEEKILSPYYFASQDFKSSPILVWQTTRPPTK